MTDASIKDFEAAIAELDAVVKKLEEGDLSLEQSLRSLRLFADEVMPRQ